MILEIKIPELNHHNLLIIFQQIGIYALSFIVIGITWINYNSFFVLLEKVNTKIIWLNLALLFFMSLVPLPTKLLGENFTNNESHLLYGIILTTVSLAYTLLQLEANRFTDTINNSSKTFLNAKNWIATLLYGLSIPASFISIYISGFIFALLPVLYFIPSKKVTNFSS